MSWSTKEKFLEIYWTFVGFNKIFRVLVFWGSPCTCLILSPLASASLLPFSLQTCPSEIVSAGQKRPLQEWEAYRRVRRNNSPIIERVKPLNLHFGAAAPVERGGRLQEYLSSGDWALSGRGDWALSVLYLYFYKLQNWDT